ncbi:Hypothetical protein mma_2531 [Janthinobacterium sp. Marseille]|nr:hypothetical protein [Janthinobacterium sp. Marseille]ABR91883.1 Hypothetical protein mma_2531 [Janthinobacterium sp. Marseille]
MNPNKRILELLKLRETEKLKLINIPVCDNFLMLRAEIFATLFLIRSELNLYSNQEIENAKTADELNRKYFNAVMKRPKEGQLEYVEEEEVNFLFLLVMLIIYFSDSKNKAFLMLGLALIVEPTEKIKRLRNTI